MAGPQVTTSITHTASLPLWLIFGRSSSRQDEDEQRQRRRRQHYKAMSRVTSAGGS